MSEVGSYEAKTRLSELLRQVKIGQKITITHRGKAMADLVPSISLGAKDKVAAVEKLKVFMRTNPTRHVNIKELMREGRS
jgi:prevent-host-death family protein